MLKPITYDMLLSKNIINSFTDQKTHYAFKDKIFFGFEKHDGNLSAFAYTDEPTQAFGKIHVEMTKIMAKKGKQLDGKRPGQTILSKDVYQGGEQRKNIALFMTDLKEKILPHMLDHYAALKKIAR